MPSHLDMKRGGSPSPASHSDLLLLWGRVVALGLSFHFPVAGQRVAAWCGLDSITSVVLARFPPTQVDTRSTPQLREHRHKGCTHVTGPSSASQTCLDSASGQGPLLALPCLAFFPVRPHSPSWLGLSPPEGGSTRGQAHSSSGCPPGPHWDSAAIQAERHCGSEAWGGSGLATHPFKCGLRLWTHPTPPPHQVHVHCAPQHLLVLGRQAPAAGLQPPIVVAHVLAHLAVLLSLLLPPGRGGAVAGRARGTKEYFSVFGDLRSHGLALQRAPNALGALPPRPVLSFPGH